jgi:hypothetical protein
MNSKYLIYNMDFLSILLDGHLAPSDLNTVYPLSSGILEKRDGPVYSPVHRVPHFNPA